MLFCELGRVCVQIKILMICDLFSQPPHPQKMATGIKSPCSFKNTNYENCDLHIICLAGDVQRPS